MPRRDLIGQEYAARIDGEIEIPLRVGQFKRALHGRDAGVGDADIATAQMLERFAERALDRGALAHVDLDATALSPISFAVRCAASPSISAITTFTPLRASACAMARPMPCAPPVTNARLPLSSE